MNEQIRQLVRQAGLDDADFPIEDWDNVPLAKFAELIVRECMKVAVNKDSGYMHPADVAGYMAAGRSTAAHMIKEHFGVKE